MRRGLRLAGELLLLVGVALLAAALLRAFALETAKIHTRSMTRTLLPGDVVVINKLVYGPSTPAELPFTSLPIPSVRLPALIAYRCGDVVLVNRAVAGDQPRRLLKRIIGLPGDSLEIRRGIVFRNGQALPLPPEAQGAGDDTVRPFAIPRPGETIMLTPASLSLFGGAIAAETQQAYTERPVSGELPATYRVRQEWYYLLGDDRGNSVDSRVWGCVTLSEIVGKPFMIFWSRDEEGGSGGFAGIRWDRLGKIVR